MAFEQEWIPDVVTSDDVPDIAEHALEIVHGDWFVELHRAVDVADNTTTRTKNQDETDMLCLCDDGINASFSTTSQGCVKGSSVFPHDRPIKGQTMIASIDGYDAADNRATRERIVAGSDTISAGEDGSNGNHVVDGELGHVRVALQLDIVGNGFLAHIPCVVNLGGFRIRTAIAHIDDGRDRSLSRNSTVVVQDGGVLTVTVIRAFHETYVFIRANLVVQIATLIQFGRSPQSG